MTPIALRRAEPADADAAAEVWLRSRHAAVPVVPAPVHTDAEVRHHFQTVVVPTRETWLAVVGEAVVGVMVLDGDEVDQLYVDPDWQRRGVGSTLLQLAQARRPGGLALWTFQSNGPARRFYERHGFLAVAWTDGSTNDGSSPHGRRDRLDRSWSHPKRH
jgi:GNAT superfamily N-acetyltransferase